MNTVSERSTGAAEPIAQTHPIERFNTRVREVEQRARGCNISVRAATERLIGETDGKEDVSTIAPSEFCGQYGDLERSLNYLEHVISDLEQAAAELQNV